jgi:hypothetical protein
VAELDQDLEVVESWEVVELEDTELQDLDLHPYKAIVYF